MKRNDIDLLASRAVNIIIEYITQILNDNEVSHSTIDLYHSKFDGTDMCTIDIYVPHNNFEKHINLGVGYEYINIIYKEFLNRVISEFLPHEYIGATKFYSSKGELSNFDGIKLLNTAGSEVEVNMYGIDKNISNEYNSKYDEYKSSIGNKTL
nr:hypothetical protein [Bacilli bacterium]